MKVDHGIRVVHFASDRGGEHIGISWVLFALLNQQVYCHLRDGDFPDGSLRLGAGQGEFSVWILDVLLADRDGAVFNIQVGP